MRRSHITLFLVLVSPAFHARSADARTASFIQHSVAIDIGVGDHHLRDQLLSPLIYRGFSRHVGMLYRKQGRRSFHSVELDVGFGDINSRVPHHTQAGVRGYLRYGHLRRVASFAVNGRTGTLFVGGSWQSFIDGAFEKRFDNTSAIIAHSLNVAGSVDYSVAPRHSITWDLQLPVVSYVIRPAYAGYDEPATERQNDPLALATTNGTFAAPNRYLMVISGVRYGLSVSRTVDLTTHYRFWYYSYHRPRSVRAYNHRMSVGVTITL